MNEKKIEKGLRPLPKDQRDISLGAFIKLPKLEELPVNFRTSEPLRIKDQKDTDKCTSYALTAVSEDQEGVELNPDYQFTKTKELEGEYESWGADLRTACKSAVKFGSLEEKDKPSIDGNDRNWRLWPEDLWKLSEIHKKQSYLKVDGPYDLFDNFRASIWAMRKEKRSIITGVLWRSVWSGVPNGIIPKFITEKQGFGHAFKVFGWKEINGESYLVAQLSNGVDFGDNGIFYFPRIVVNREFTYGAYTFSDMPAEEAKQKGWTLWQRLIHYFRSYL